jgi:hypothetical protein
MSSEHTLSTCCRLVSSFLTEMVQQIHSLRASGVMSSQAASAFASDVIAFRRSAGRLCTTPPEIRTVVIGLSRTLKDQAPDTKVQLGFRDYRGRSGSNPHSRNLKTGPRAIRGLRGEIWGTNFVLNFTLRRPGPSASNNRISFPSLLRICITPVYTTSPDTRGQTDGSGIPEPQSRFWMRRGVAILIERPGLR